MSCLWSLHSSCWAKWENGRTSSCASDCLCVLVFSGLNGAAAEVFLTTHDKQALAGCPAQAIRPSPNPNLCSLERHDDEPAHTLTVCGDSRLTQDTLPAYPHLLLVYR